MEFAEFAVSAVWFVALFTTLVFVHELGHWTVARWFGVGVEVVSIGVGPTLVWARRGGTVFRLAAFPLAGYVRFRGEGTAAGEYLALGRGARAAVAAAGPVANLVVSLGISTGLAMSGVESAWYLDEAPVVGRVDVESPAMAAGFRPGERITAVDGRALTTWRELEQAVLASPGREMRFDLADETAARSVVVAPQAVATTVGLRMGYLGAGPGLESAALRVVQTRPGGPAARAGLLVGDEVLAAGERRLVERAALFSVVQCSAGRPVRVRVRRDGVGVFDVEVEPEAEGGAFRIGATVEVLGVKMRTRRRDGVQAFFHALECDARIARSTWTALGQAIAGRAPATDALAGPVALVGVAGLAARQGPEAVLGLAALVSLSMCVFNLLPIPGLDGGVLLLEGLSAILARCGRTLSDEARARVTAAGLALCFGFAAWVAVVDISRRAGPAASDDASGVRCPGSRPGAKGE